MSQADVSVKILPEQYVAFAVCTGGYQNLSPRLNRLFGWVKEQGLRMVGAPGGRFPGTPDEAEQGKTEWELYVPVPADTMERPPDAEQIGVKRIGAREAAVALYIGPYARVRDGYPALMQWLESNAVTVAGPVEEWWLDDDDEVAEAELRTEIAYPIKRE